MTVDGDVPMGMVMAVVVVVGVGAGHGKMLYYNITGVHRSQALTGGDGRCDGHRHCERSEAIHSAAS